MRQVGIFAAAGLYALDHNLERLREDHENAQLIGRRLVASKRVVLDLATLQTNIIVFGLTDEAPDAHAIVEGARARGVLIYAFGPKTIRAVTHLDVSRQQCEQAANILLDLING